MHTYHIQESVQQPLGKVGWSTGCVHVHTFAHMWACMYVYVCVYMYVCVYVCMYAHAREGLVKCIGLVVRGGGVGQGCWLTCSLEYGGPEVHPTSGA